MEEKLKIQDEMVMMEVNDDYGWSFIEDCWIEIMVQEWRWRLMTWDFGLDGDFYDYGEDKDWWIKMNMVNDEEISKR